MHFETSGNFFLTIFTLIGFLLSVSSNVLCETTTFGKTFLTLFTLIEFLLCVSSNVLFEITTLGKTFLMIFTLMRLLLCVSSDMQLLGTIFDFLSSKKSLFKWCKLFSCMPVCVYVKSVQGMKMSFAKATRQRSQKFYFHYIVLESSLLIWLVHKYYQTSANNR